MNAEKYNLYYGIFFLIMGIIGIYFTITQFSLEQLVIMLLEFTMAVSQFELYHIKFAKRGISAP